MFADNVRAISLYEKLDFHREGCRMKDVKTRDGGIYIDSLLMAKFV